MIDMLCTYTVPTVVPRNPQCQEVLTQWHIEFERDLANFRS